MLSSLLRRSCPSRAKARRATSKRPGVAFRPWFEPLEARALMTAVHLDPPIPAQCPGAPPVQQTVFERTVPVNVAALASGEPVTIDVTRAGDFNNPTATTDGNGAPQEGIAVFGVSQSTPGRTYRWVFWPGIAGTRHVCDDPAHRQSLPGSPVNAAELRDTIDAAGRAHVRVAVGSGVDDAGLLNVAFNLPTAPADGAGNTLGTARDLGPLGAPQTLRDFVGQADTNDYYRFTLNEYRAVSVRLDGLSADADLELLDRDGRILARSTAGGANADSITRSLAAGTYFLRVYQYSGDTNYTLTVTATANDDALAGARDLGTLAGTPVVVQDSVGAADLQDFFRFRVAQPGDVRVRLDGMTADADLELLDASGLLLARSTHGGTSADEITRSLDAGTYHLRVYRYSGDTQYTLTLSPPPPPNDDTLATARQLGSLTAAPTTVRDRVDRNDRNDYFRFDLAQRSQFRLRLEGLAADADVELLDATGRVLARSTNGGNRAEAITRALAAGTYYVRVFRYSGDTNYDLSLSADPLGPTHAAIDQVFANGLD